MKITALLLFIVLAGCSSKADPVPSKEDAYTQWHSITAKIVVARKSVLDLQEEREKLNTSMEAECKKLTPVSTWAIIDEVGPRCFDTKVVERVQAQARMQQAQAIQEAPGGVIPALDPTLPKPTVKK